MKWRKKSKEHLTNRALNVQVDHLRQLNRHGKLSVFVGAGISQGCGLPGWDQLIERVSSRIPKKSLRFELSAIDKLDNVTKTRVIRELLGTRFVYDVGQSLYETTHDLSEAVTAVALLGADRICTYNFDDILEEALTVEGVGFHSFTPGRPVNSNYGGVNVYHVHGLLPSGASLEECKEIEIVFDETDFNQLYSDPYSWANLIQLSMLMSSSCLFVGCSVRDPNLRRLLDTCRRLKLTHKHFAIVQSPLQGTSGPERLKARNQRTALKVELSSLNVEPVWIGQWSDLTKILESIRNKENLRRQQDVGAAPVRP
ncbi:hypothetical protein ASF69_01710 [Rhizobium sp. Leaf311]|uniref:SIR2 family protein n=1 Tax=Rhizobium sp. Leaf311 TaxID=1736332 RepID=UPI000713F0D4|nr:SIR2 family protein [Rhizobium sp. Leaf311]KQQ61166.1 hypothetical protein ASF69_01710 [Rhizobium sp. Leaf311]